MNSIFGKLSILCGIVLWCVFVANALTLKNTNPSEFQVVYVTMRLGALLGVIGWVKNESPQIYCIAGMILNVAVFFMLKE